MRLLKTIFGDQRGQDLIEYTLLLGFLALGSAALFVGTGHSVKGIWSTASSQLQAGTPTQPGGSGGGGNGDGGHGDRDHGGYGRD